MLKPRLNIFQLSDRRRDEPSAGDGGGDETLKIRWMSFGFKQSINFHSRPNISAVHRFHRSFEVQPNICAIHIYLEIECKIEINHERELANSRTSSRVFLQPIKGKELVDIFTRFKCHIILAVHSLEWTLITCVCRLHNIFSIETKPSGKPSLEKKERSIASQTNPQKNRN